MESGNGGASSKGVLVPVPDTSDVFQNCILAPLQSAYLYEESKQSFRYKSAVLIKNPVLEEKYNAFRAKRREVGYSEEDLKETYGFLLFDDVNTAHSLGETGLLTGNGTCTTLGDPWKGVYISMYSDCLDPNRWYHGKSGYIAIVRLTKGRVKKVLENYTQNFTAPTVGFDCHVSEDLSSVSAKTSSFLAFERTQYYMYELLDDGSSETAQSPSAACPFAIVSFSYTDSKATLVAPQETSEERKLVCHYLPWRGQLQVGSQSYDVGLRSTSGALIPAKLPPVVKVDRAISMSDLTQLLPKAAFETCFSGEVYLDGSYCSLCELVPSEAEGTNSLSLLLREIKEKDLALPVPLNDGGFLILLHASHFLTYDETGSNTTEVLQGMFVFPDSRVIQKDTKSGWRKAAVSSDILRVLPVLSYAEGEVEKTPFNPSEELCEVLAQHMQNYAALINPGLALSPSREVSIFPDQYDVPDAHKHLYSSPEWTDKAWQSFRSYVSKPVSYQLPVSKASEILAAGQEERREDLDDDVYICLSSPEEVLADPVSMGSEDRLTEQESPVNVEISMDSCITSADAQVDLTAVPENVVPEDLQTGDATKDNEKSDLTVLIKTDDTGAKTILTPPSSDDLSAELIVSITSERTVTDESLNVISTVPATKHNDFQLSGFSAAKLQTEGVNSMHDETVKIKNKDCTEVTNFTKTKRRKLRRGHAKGQKKASKAYVETLHSQTVKRPEQDGISMSQKDDQAKESLGHSQLNNPLNIDWRKLPRRKRRFGLSSKNKKVRSVTVGFGLVEEKKSDPGQPSVEGTVLMELEVCPLRKKTERWDLKPVISECGRILVPHGSAVGAHQIKSLTDKIQSTTDEQYPEKMLVDAPENAHDRVEMEQEPRTASETAVDKTEATTNTDDDSLPLNPQNTDYFSKNDGTGTPPSEAIKEKHTDNLSPGKCATKGECLLSKLKSVLSRGKRKTDFLMSEGTTADTAKDAEPCLKKGRGLTPKEKPAKVQKSEGHDSQLRKDSSETQEQIILDKQPQIIQKPPSIFPRRGRIKTLKKHQGVSAEHIKKKCTPFQVSPLSGSTRLLHHHQQLYGDGIQTLHPSVCQEDRGKHNHRSPDYLKKQMVRRQRFRHSRTFVNKDGSIQVTRQWNENYDFNRDSKFTSDSKDRAIIRALHGPWDFSIQDTTEEVRLIVHMWIGLFYSRSTARFFHIDLNCTYPYSEGSDPLELSSGKVSAPAQTELKANSFGGLPSVADTQDPSISKALDLSKKDNSVLDQGSVILDLSLRNSSAEAVTSDPQANKKETSVSGEQKEASETVNTIKSSVELQECNKMMVPSAETIDEVNDVKSICENEKTCSPSQKAGGVEHTDVPSFKGDGSLIPPQEEVESVSIQTENVQTASGIGHMSHGCNKEETHMIDGSENSETLEMNLVQKHATDSSESVTDKEVEYSKDADDLVHTEEHEGIKTKDGETWEVKENPCQKGNREPSPKVIDLPDDPTNTKLGILCNDNCLENGNQSSNEEPKAVSTGQAENVNKDVDCCTGHEGTMTTDEDHFGKDDGLNEKDRCALGVEADSDLTDQPLPMMCDGPDSVKEECITDCSHQAPSDEQPSQADNKEDACHDLQLRKPCGNGSALTDECAISEKATPSEIEPVCNEPAVEENPENDICLVDKADDQKALSPEPDESTYSLYGAIPQTKETLGTGSENTGMVVSSDHEDQETKLVVGEEKCGNTTQEEPFHHHSHSPQCEVMKECEDEEALSEETDIKMDKTNEGLENSHSRVVIPFIGMDISGEDIVQPLISYPQDKTQVVHGQKGIPFISEATYPDLPSEVCRTSEMYSDKEEPSAGKISLRDVSETNQPVILGSECNDRCPTPTVDEMPYECTPSSSTSAFTSSETYKNFTQKCLSRSSTPTKDEVSLEHKLCLKSTVNSDPKAQYGLHPDLELRTLRVLQSIDKFLSESNHTDKSSQIQTADMTSCLDQTHKLSSKYIPTCLAPSHTTADLKDSKISNSKPAVVSASSSQESSDHFLISPFKSKLEEVLGVRLQLKKTDSPLPQQYFGRTDKLQEASVGQDYCHSYTSIPSTECLQSIKTNLDQDRPKTSQSNLNHEPRSYSQRPVMAVKPSKSDEGQADYTCKDEQLEYSPKKKQTKSPVFTYTASSAMPLEKRTENFKGRSVLNDDKQESSEFSSKSSWWSNVSDSNTDKAKLALLEPSYQYQGKDISKFNKIFSSSLPMLSFDSSKM
uniref:TASOR pseudo-PARP domain-containing protein n=1 Tax=Lates calcarifer TaxID=8187 RepID=A0A4W6F6U5_LATCA